MSNITGQQSENLRRVMNENNVQAINEYMDWLRDKRMHPPTGSPEEWLEEQLNTDARKRLNLLSDYLLNLDELLDSDYSEVLVKIHSFVFDPLEVIEDDPGV
jgi:hypothetical protein